MFPGVDGTPPDHLAAQQLPTRWRIDDRRCSRTYRHAWFARDGGPGTTDLFQRGLVHLDLAAGTLDHWHAHT